MKRVIPGLVLMLFLIPYASRAQFEKLKDSVVQFYGVVMTADSLEGIPAVTIMVKGENRATISNDQGVFSIVVLKGQQVEFTSIGYKPKLVTIPRILKATSIA
jgi:hypothetical protein